MAKDPEVAYETILKYSDKNFYPNKNYKKNINSDEKNIHVQNILYTENIPQNVPQLNSQNDAKNISTNISEINIQGIQNVENIQNFQNIQNIQNIENSKEMNNIRYLRLNRRLLHKNSFHIALTACSGTGDMVTAYKIIDLMVDNDIPMRSDTFNALLDTVKKLTVMFFSILFFLFFYFIPFYFILFYFPIFIMNLLFQEFFDMFL